MTPITPRDALAVRGRRSSASYRTCPRTLVAVALSVLILSAAGLYALMSVIVTRRRREIGIRIALGADQRRVLTGIFSRAALQIGPASR